MLKIVPVALLDAVIAAYPPPEVTKSEAPKPEAPKSVAGAAKLGGGYRMRVGDNRVARCRAYLKTLDPAVMGQQGSNRTFHAARLIWAEFEIDEAEGYPLLEEFNQRCQPPWEEDGKQGLKRKWDEAVKKGGPRGGLLNADRPGYTPNGTVPPTTPTDPPAATTAAPGGRPSIVHNERQYRDVEFDAAKALIAWNNPPQVFVGNGGGLVDLVRPDPGGPPRARELDGPSMRPVFGRVADWFKLVRDEEGDRLVPDFPPHALLSSFPARGTWPGVPFLRCIVTYPVFTPDWELLTETGYHAGSHLYCHLDGLEVPPIPDRPTPEELERAKFLILTDVLGDFKFVDDASRAHAVAMLLLPCVRHTIDGPTPLALLDAPTEGTGKSLLAEASMLLTLGEVPEAMTADLKEEERDKTLTALLIEGQPVIFFDNANRKLDSGSFANTLTARRKRGRILGETKTVSAMVNVCWVLTGNNFTCSREIARRLYWCRQDTGLETPSERTEFRHPDLLEWVRDNRPQLLWALAVLVRHWRATGAVPGDATLGKFERWAKTVGGILKAAGIPGFLGNSERFRKQCADTVGELAEFVKLWAKKHQGNPVISNDLFDLARDSLENVLTAENDDGKRKQLGRFLAKCRDRTVGQYRIRAAVDEDGKEDTDHKGRSRYRLEETTKPRAKATEPPDEGQFEMR